MSVTGEGGDALPLAFLEWVEKPLGEALEKLDRVPLRLETHAALMEVRHELRNTRKACMELRRLAEWMRGQSCVTRRRKPLASKYRRG